jgi:protein-disulfide isomerase
MPGNLETPTLSLPVSEGRDHIQGPPSAAVTLVEYGDYECPACGRVAARLPEILEDFTDDVRFVFRNFPLTQLHPHAQRAAEAAEAAGAQGRFWEMHDTLYDRQGALTDQDLMDYASEIGLDVERFEQELSGGAHAARVREDFMSGVRSGVNGTPTFFINGRRHDGGLDPRSLAAAIAEELGQPPP